jgi:hypothetical protein
VGARLVCPECGSRKVGNVKNNDPGLVELRAMILKARRLADDHVEQERAGRRYPLCRHPGNASRLLGRPSPDRLGPAREIAQIGAVMGREFSYDLLRTPTAINEIRLTAALDQLVASELVSQRGTPPGASYVFKHALVQEAAHETLLRTERRRLHSYVGQCARAENGSGGAATRAAGAALRRGGDHREGGGLLDTERRAEAPRMAARGVELALSRVFNRHLHPRPAGADRGSAGHVMCRRQFDTRG